MIPKIIHRIIPETPKDIHEQCWKSVQDSHGSDWELITHTAPEKTSEGWEITREYWNKCAAPAFMCDLMRLEVLWNYGGIYLDSDVYIFKNLSPLIGEKPFVGLEDGIWLCNAVMGFPAKHPALLELINETKRILDLGEVAHPPFTTTDIFGLRDDITFLSQKEFYFYGPMSRKIIPSKLEELRKTPGVYGIHLWDASWFESGEVPEYLLKYSSRIVEGTMKNAFKEVRRKKLVKEDYGIRFQ